MFDAVSQIDINSVLEFIDSPSFQTLQLGLITYLGLLWLSIIIWVTRDAIHRSDSLIFQVIAILLNIIFPVLGVLLYLIIRPSKTSNERYYEEMEHKLIMEAIEEKKPQVKKVKKAESKTESKKEK